MNRTYKIKVEVVEILDGEESSLSVGYMTEDPYSWGTDLNKAVTDMVDGIKKERVIVPDVEIPRFSKDFEERLVDGLTADKPIREYQE